jgi:hypothetical protein
MVALLFWEPRRYWVMAVKLTILASVTAVLGVAAQGAWLLAARVLAGLRGTTATPARLWAQLAATSGRGVLLVVLVGLFGFAVANLVRNTAAAFGAGFVYFAIVENVIRAVRPAWQPWLLSDSASALVAHGGQKIFLNEGFVDARGFYQSTGRELVVSNLHGGLLLGAVTALIVTAGVVLFARRDPK